MPNWTTKYSISSPANAGYAWAGNGTNIYYTRYDGSGNIRFDSSTTEGSPFSGDAVFAAGNDVPLDTALIVDPTNSKIHALYASGVDTGSNAALLYRNTANGGSTWSSEIILDSGASHGTNRFYRTAITAFNDIINVYYISASNTNFVTDGLWAVRSTDGGNTFTSPVKQFTSYSSTVMPTRPTVYRDGQSIYLTWYDPEVLANNGGDVYFARSDDNGGTWATAPIQISTGLTSGRPTVSASGGNINIAFMYPFGLNIVSDIYTAYSSNNGNTWSLPVKTLDHGAAALGYTHPWLEQWDKNNVVILVCDRQHSILVESTSQNGGNAWGVPQTVMTYNTANASDAVRAFYTANYLHAVAYDGSPLNDMEYLRRPLYEWSETQGITTGKTIYKQLFGN